MLLHQPRDIDKLTRFNLCKKNPTFSTVSFDKYLVITPPAELFPLISADWVNIQLTFEFRELWPANVLLRKPLKRFCD